MILSPDTMRILLVTCLAGMVLLAAFYLRRRELSIGAYLMWGLLVLMVPLLGPFLVILSHPGQLRAMYQRRVRHINPLSRMAAAARRIRTLIIRCQRG